MEGDEARFMKTKLHLRQKEIRDLIVESLLARDFRTTGGVHVAFVTEQDGSVSALVENMRERTEEERPAEGTPIAQLSRSRLRELADQVLVREGAEGDAGEIAEHAFQILLDHKEVGAVDGSRAFHLALVELTPRMDVALRDLEEEGRAEFIEDEDEDPYWRTKRKSKKRPSKQKTAGTGRQAVAQRDTVDVISGEEILNGATCVWFNDFGATVTHPDDWPEDLRKEHDPSPTLFDFLEEQGEAEPSANAAADILGGDGGVMDRGDALGEAVGDERPAPARGKGPARRRKRRA